MSDDLVKRLREYDKPGITMSEAADRIEQLEAALQQKNTPLYEVLRVHEGEIPDTEIYGVPVMCDGERIFPRLGDDIVLFAARAALGEDK